MLRDVSFTIPIPFGNPRVLFLKPWGVLTRVIKPITPYLGNQITKIASKRKLFSFNIDKRNVSLRQNKNRDLTLPQISVVQKHTHYDANLALPSFFQTFCFELLNSIRRWCQIKTRFIHRYQNLRIRWYWSNTIHRETQSKHRLRICRRERDGGETDRLMFAL